MVTSLSIFLSGLWASPPAQCSNAGMKKRNKKCEVLIQPSNAPNCCSRQSDLKGLVCRRRPDDNTMRQGRRLFERLPADCHAYISIRHVSSTKGFFWLPTGCRCGTCNPSIRFLRLQATNWIMLPCNTVSVVPIKVYSTQLKGEHEVM